MTDFGKLSKQAMAIVTLGVGVVIGIAVLGKIKEQGLVANATVELFETGLALIGTFIAVIVIAISGKMALNALKQ